MRAGAPTLIAVLASGRGTNFESIQREIEAGRLHAKIAVVISDRTDAPVLAKARAFGIPALAVPSVKPREEHDRAVLAALTPYAPEYLVMAGYLRVVTPVLIEAFRDEQGYTRIVNVHPSLLPAFAGLESYAQAFQYGVHWTGVTVHLVEQDVDCGPIIAQEAFRISDCRDEAEVERRGLKIEHRLFPETLDRLFSKKIRVEARVSARSGLRRLCVRPD